MSRGKQILQPKTVYDYVLILVYFSFHRNKSGSGNLIRRVGATGYKSVFVLWSIVAIDNSFASAVPREPTDHRNSSGIKLQQCFFWISFAWLMSKSPPSVTRIFADVGTNYWNERAILIKANPVTYVQLHEIYLLTYYCVTNSCLLLYLIMQYSYHVYLHTISLG